MLTLWTFHTPSSVYIDAPFFASCAESASKISLIVDCSLSLEDGSGASAAVADAGGAAGASAEAIGACGGGSGVGAVAAVPAHPTIPVARPNRQTFRTGSLPLGKRQEDELTPTQRTNRRVRRGVPRGAGGMVNLRFARCFPSTSRCSVA